MNLQRLALAWMGIVFLFAGSLSAQDVKTDYDHSADFAQYRTYS